MWNHRICGGNCPGSQQMCFKVLMQKRREGWVATWGMWAGVSTSRLITSSVQSQLKVNQRCLGKLWQLQMSLILLFCAEKRSFFPGNDVLAPRLIWSQVQFILKRSEWRGWRGTHWQRLKACKIMHLLVRVSNLSKIPRGVGLFKLLYHFHYRKMPLPQPSSIIPSVHGLELKLSYL